MSPKIGILYTVGNDFLPQLTIWGTYLKIRPRLARIHSQSFDNPSRKVCFEIRPLSSLTKGTITIVGSKGTCSSQELSSTTVGAVVRQWQVAGWPRVVTTTNGTVSRWVGLPLLISAPFVPCPSALGRGIRWEREEWEIERDRVKKKERKRCEGAKEGSLESSPALMAPVHRERERESEGDERGRRSPLFLHLIG